MPKIMGPFVNGRFASTLGWVLAIVVIFINFYQIYTTPMQKCMNSTTSDGMVFGSDGGYYDLATSSKLQYTADGAAAAAAAAAGDESFGPGAVYDYDYEYGNGTGAVGVACHVADPMANGFCAVGQTCHTEMVVVPIALVSVVYLAFVGWLMVGPLLQFSWNPIRDWYEPMDAHHLKMLGPGMTAGLESTTQEKDN